MIKYKYISNLVGYEISWVGLLVIVDYIVTNLSIIDTIVSFGLTVWLQGWKSVLTWLLLDTVTYQDKANEHLVFHISILALCSVCIRVRVG